MLWLRVSSLSEAIFTNKVSVLYVPISDILCVIMWCVLASMKAAKPLHIVWFSYKPEPTRARSYPLNINPKPESISGPAGSGRVADL